MAVHLVFELAQEKGKFQGNYLAVIMIFLLTLGTKYFTQHSLNKC